LPGGVRVALELSRAEVHCDRFDLDAAEAAAQRALAFLTTESPGTARDLAWACAQYFLGSVALDRGDVTRAEECIRRSLATRERHGDQEGIAWCWGCLGHSAMRRGDLAGADECWRRCQALMEGLGEPQGVWISLLGLSYLALARGELAAAEGSLRRGLAICEGVGLRVGTAHFWQAMGDVALARGDPGAAEQRFQHATLLLEEIGWQGPRPGPWVMWPELPAIRHRG
jgi:hypothetical protein